MSDPLTVQPSQTMCAIHRMAGVHWQRLRHEQVVGEITGGLAEIPGADGAHMGWGILGICLPLTSVLDQIAAGVNAPAFAAQAKAGLENGVVIACAVGYELIDRGQLRGSGRLQVPEELAMRRPGVAAAAASAIRDSMASPAFAEGVLDNARDQGRWAGRGMITRLTTELPGIDPVQAGVALLTCGGVLVHQAGQAGLGKATSGFRGRRKAAEGMTYAGTGLAGAVMAQAGDACLPGA